jgi:serine/threonine protein kinase
MINLNKEKNTVQRVKIIDFGFAIYKNNLNNLDKRSKFAGTPGFVAPEIFLGEEYDESVDMFSLGIIMYFMLCGNLPFNSPIY